ncbi:MAG: hypothetical protein KFF46_01755, partial [Desulfobacterales bacterium]|nr:hypothetical protein [Desulfobacterales bacterium]
EENLRARGERVRETSDYVQDELRMAQERLEKKEAEMKEYKLKHYNEMPDQRNANMNRLDSLQRQFQDLQTNIYNLEQTRLLMSEQLEARRNMQNEMAGGGVSASAEELSQLRGRLQDLLGRYTAAHPEVKRLEKRIERFQSAMSSAGEQPDQEASAAGTGAASPRDDRINELAARIKEIDINLRTLRKESNNVLEEIETYKNYVEAAPVREAEWTALTRDYEELKQYHDQLLSQSFGAEAAETIEVRQKGSQFKIVDPAFLPKTPVEGRFLVFLLVSVAIGLAGGGGMVLGIDAINTSFRDVAEVESSLQLPVTCALPLIVTEKEQKSAKLRSIAWSSALTVWLIALITAGVYLWQQGELIL